MKALPFVVFSLFAVVSVPAYAQGTATGPSQADVLSACQEVAQGGPDGSCIAATQAYLDAVAASDPTGINEDVTALVVALAPLAQTGNACRKDVNAEIAAAIKLASTYTTDSAQVARIIEISNTIADCQVVRTAAVRPTTTSPGTPGSLSSTGSGAPGTGPISTVGQ